MREAVDPETAHVHVPLEFGARSSPVPEICRGRALRDRSPGACEQVRSAAVPPSSRPVSSGSTWISQSRVRPPSADRSDRWHRRSVGGRPPLPRSPRSGAGSVRPCRAAATWRRRRRTIPEALRRSDAHGVRQAHRTAGEIAAAVVVGKLHKLVSSSAVSPRLIPERSDPTETASSLDTSRPRQRSVRHRSAAVRARRRDVPHRVRRCDPSR